VKVGGVVEIFAFVEKSSFEFILSLKALLIIEEFPFQN